jgi:hypothetical protein
VKLRIRYAFHPDNLSAKNPRLVEDLQDFSLEAIVATIKMIADFYEFGLESRCVKKLQGLPVWELKTQSRGGVKVAREFTFLFQVMMQSLLIVKLKMTTRRV